MTHAMTETTTPLPVAAPCEHCGSTDIFIEREDLSAYQARCNDCGSRGPIVEEGRYYDNEEAGQRDAIIAWNRRAAPAAMQDDAIAAAASAYERLYIDTEGQCSADDVARAVLSAAPSPAPAAPSAAQWMPIETAPKDGTRIDVWLGDDEFPMRRTDVYWGRPHHECGEAGSYCDSCPPDRDMWCDDLSYGEPEDLNPTHWMPLPAAPGAQPAQPDAMPLGYIPIPQGLHPDTADLVCDFAAGLAEKLRASEVKYGWDTNWKRLNWRDELAAELLRHVHKGDPIDVAAYCAFAWHHGWSVTPAQGGSVSEAATVAMVIPYTDEDDRPDMPEWRMITIGRPGDIPDHVLDRIPAKAAGIICEAINAASLSAARASAPAAPEVVEKPILWCVHHIGPDDLHPVESYEAAIKTADAINDQSEKFNFGHKPDSMNYVYSRAYPAIWTGTPESHAEWLEKRRAAIRSAGEAADER